jgi:superfamily II DNA or RNA helicase
VLGSRRYDVSLELEDGVLILDCSCPYLETSGACKHLWAVILAADAQGYLSAIGADVEIEIGGDAVEWDLKEDDLGSHDEEFESEWDERRSRAGLVRSGGQFPATNMRPAQPSWKTQIADVSGDRAQTARFQEWPAKRRILYVVDTPSSIAAGYIVLSLRASDIKKDGSYTRPLALGLQRAQIPSLPLAEDRAILSALAGAGHHNSYEYGYVDHRYGYSYQNELGGAYVLRPPLAATLFPEVVQTGRCRMAPDLASEDLIPVAWDGAEPWRFELELRLGGERKDASVSVVGILRRGEESLEISVPKLVARGGFVFANGMAAPLAEDTAFDWLLHLRKTGGIQAPAQDCEELMETLLCAPGLPRLEVPEHLRYEEVTAPFQPGVRIHAAGRHSQNARLPVELFFDYGGRQIPSLDPSRGVCDRPARRFLCRDRAAEAAAASFLSEAGAKPRAPALSGPNAAWDVAPTKVPRLTRTLVEAGWHVEADGRVFRRPGAFRLDVSSGIDWFELRGGVQYGEVSAKLPELLEALRRGEGVVRLDDGTYGMLPEEWLRRIGMLAGMGTPEDGLIRFRRTQVGLLDALLTAQPEIQFDATFARVRDELRRFQGIEAAAQPEGFAGRLRDYQREGLGWMEFLRRYGFGGCLADDMGVGKTAQVLALLEKRRELRAAGTLDKPSLGVVPRSLVFNWRQEAERFTPRLRVLDYTGGNRSGCDFSAYDLVLTTYGTLRRDAARLRDVEFDYVVLDEAQAVKNGGSESAKAVRLLRGEHRLALSGTPVENHLGELWSLFEFLNPGMLGAASVFKSVSAARRAVDEDSRRLLAHALRPFILRRTKEQVVRELPAKTEQTIYCELEPPQRRLYNELRRHYRDSLLARIESQGMGKSKIMVLEALLRLRQAACHPGLIDLRRTGEPSAKLEALQAELREVLDAGHKALVFSQFTSLLKIVRDRLDGERVAYEYLDGETRNRQARVERFQNDPDCGVFLVSLKAGGLGLNLTAAEYVFLLDPWWNPAAEAQAVDRAHRIGQMRPVFAYRLIARDTVEEKVIELQQSKRELAAAIIGEDNALIRDLRREDLELLLS